MDYEYIQRVYFNKEITDRPLDDKEDRRGKFCVIEMKSTALQEGRKNSICDMLSCMMKLMGYPGEIFPKNFSGEIEINHWRIHKDDAIISIQHKYWNGYEMKLFCTITAALRHYLHFEIEYLSAEQMRRIGT